MGTRRERRRAPTYSLESVKRLVEEGKVRIGSRPRVFIRNRVGRFDTKAFMQELFEALDPDDFYKTEELNVLPGTWADVYKSIPFTDAESGETSDWYLKFYVEGDYLRVHVLSANYDGYIH